MEKQEIIETLKELSDTLEHQKFLALKKISLTSSLTDIDYYEGCYETLVKVQNMIDKLISLFK